ncbi:hypothetical protein LCGC14_1262630 [marine sediment metagenome]|uniref:Uncharacterized protein n=1 Tax=marine sediment metagenome TaxID=412755 RepID=A0A0F9NGZ5_9ZZZZ
MDTTERDRRAAVHPDIMAALGRAVQYLGVIVAEGLLTDCAVHPQHALDQCEDALRKGLNVTGHGYKDALEALLRQAHAERRRAERLDESADAERQQTAAEDHADLIAEREMVQAGQPVVNVQEEAE